MSNAPTSKDQKQDPQKHQRLVVRAMKALTAKIQKCFKGILSEANSEALDDHARTYLTHWSSQITSESMADWLETDGGKTWISEKGDQIRNAGRAFWCRDQMHPEPFGASTIIAVFTGEDYLFLGRCLEEKPDETTKFLHLMCVARLKQEHTRLTAPTKFSIRTRAESQDGDRYVALGKMLPAVAWAFNGQGIRVPRVRVSDGDEYAAEPIPSSYVYVPRSFHIIPKGARRKAYQETIPFTLGSDGHETGSGSISLLASGVENAALLYGPEAAKLMVTLFPSAPLHGGVAEATLGELAKEIMPGESRRIQARDYRNIVKALRALRDLLLAIDKEHDVQLFTISCPSDPDTAHKEQRVSWAFSEQTRLALLGQVELGSRRSYNGWFLVNHTKLMKLDGRKVRAIPMYLRIAAQWNSSKDPISGQFDPTRLKPQALDDFLIQCDALSPRTIEYLRDQDPKNEVGRCARAQDRNGGKNLLEGLREIGLIKSWEHDGTTDLVRFMPTDRDIEAMSLVSQNPPEAENEVG